MKRLADICIELPDHHGSVLLSCPGRSIKVVIVTQILLKYLSETDGSVIIVSDNARDFGTSRGLSAEFAQDLGQHGMRADRVRIYKTLFEFVKERVIPRLRIRDDILEALENGTHPFDSGQLFAGKHDEIFQSLGEFIEPWRSFPSHFNTPEFWSPKLEKLSTVPEYFQVDSLDLEDDQIVMFVRYWVDGIVACNSKTTNDCQTGRVSFEIPASVLLDIETGEVDDFEIGQDFAYSLWPEDWPQCTWRDNSEEN